MAGNLNQDGAHRDGVARIPDEAFEGRPCDVTAVVAAARGVEGAGFPVWRGFAGLPLAALDPFVLLDQAGPVVWAPDEAKGAPWHPHRGFETVTYLLDGEIRQAWDDFQAGRLRRVPATEVGPV